MRKAGVVRRRPAWMHEQLTLLIYTPARTNEPSPWLEGLGGTSVRITKSHEGISV